MRFEPTVTLLEAMKLAAERDMVAQYAMGSRTYSVRSLAFLPAFERWVHWAIVTRNSAGSRSILIQLLPARMASPWRKMSSTARGGAGNWRRHRKVSAGATRQGRSGQQTQPGHDRRPDHRLPFVALRENGLALRSFPLADRRVVVDSMRTGSIMRTLGVGWPTGGRKPFFIMTSKKRRRGEIQ